MADRASIPALLPAGRPATRSAAGSTTTSTAGPSATRGWVPRTDVAAAEVLATGAAADAGAAAAEPTVGRAGAGRRAERSSDRPGVTAARPQRPARRRAAAAPLVEVRDLVKHFPIRGGVLQRTVGDGPGGRRRQLRRSGAARRSAWSASPAAARRRSAGCSSA